MCGTNLGLCLKSSGIDCGTRTVPSACVVQMALSARVAAPAVAVASTPPSSREYHRRGTTRLMILGDGEMNVK